MSYAFIDSIKKKWDYRVRFNNDIDKLNVFLPYFKEKYSEFYAQKVINILNMTNKFKPYLLINRARGDLMLDGQMLDVESITKFLNVDLLGVVPEGDEVIKQMIDGNVIDNDCDIV